jgi:hypothetical protein
MSGLLQHNINGQDINWIWRPHPHWCIWYIAIHVQTFSNNFLFYMSLIFLRYFFHASYQGLLSAHCIRISSPSITRAKSGYKMTHTTLSLLRTKDRVSPRYATTLASNSYQQKNTLPTKYNTTLISIIFT